MFSMMGLGEDIGFVVMQQEVEFLNCGVDDGVVVGGGRGGGWCYMARR
jgi:hypothetical protein